MERKVLTPEERMLCRREYKRRYYLKNRDKILERRRRRYLKNKDKCREYRHQYYLKNKDKYREYKRRYYLKNRDKMREKARQSYRKLYSKDSWIAPEEPMGMTKAEIEALEREIARLKAKPIEELIYKRS
ncbi:hypothetical protein Q7M48_05500 (plasmid) [Candidatus Liberibacter asiaticus]|uniref:hypothetical protein n=1 Tax=Liberibacter asiaticus TaxID=34021 RepID=UPI00044EEFE4|nr:hypothetical protein [Candidatus Liberibacter asiaticus]APD21501.1 hypothetical protein PHHCA_gp26 [Liberibacter phage HHCA1-2]ALK07726.1 hypothetical protein CD16_05495 [Candidatus Liberibacter asiaticus]KAE9517049.1 hypothetical protein FXW24_05430 [Candidatus Liberibacter asiaticus]QNF77002.1 hypothetical protein FML99_05565 [Candidatus Liberibacter asiaticus]UCZ51292.1 hypothetical protein GE519_05560 [Candidatus Liberibacter asiaticus]